MDSNLSTAESLPKKKSYKKLWIILGLLIGILVIAIIVCSGVIINTLGNETRPIADVIDSFMNYLVAKDIESAYALTSQRFQKEIPIENLRDLINGNNYALLEGYQSLSITNIKVNYGIPITAEVSGPITYNNTKGEFNATMEKVNDSWTISEFNFKKYTPNQP